MDNVLAWHAIVLATVQVFLMGTCGYVIVKSGMVDDCGLDVLTRLLVNIFLPAFFFHQLVERFDFLHFPNWWFYPLCAAAFSLCVFGVGRAVAAFCPWMRSRREFTALVMFQNSGYLPLIMVTTLFKDERAQLLYVYICLLIIVFASLIWSVGVRLVSGRRQGWFDWRQVANPPLMAILFTMLFISAGGKQSLPGFISRPVAMFSQCALPLAMLVIGGALAGIRHGETDRRALAVFVVTKMVLIPALALALVLALDLSFVPGFLIMIEAVMPSAVTLSIIARYFGGDQQFINQGIFYAHLAGLVTIPFFLSLFARFQSL